MNRPPSRRPPAARPARPAGRGVPRTLPARRTARARRVPSAHPELADEIRELFPALVEIERLKASADGPARPADPRSRPHPAERLGDYRILREIGQGGMGVVYEAVRESLGRQVAPQGPARRHRRLDADLRRFQQRGPRRRRGCTTRTSCRSSTSASTRASSITPCSSSRARAWTASSRTSAACDGAGPGRPRSPGPRRADAGGRPTAADRVAGRPGPERAVQAGPRRPGRRIGGDGTRPPARRRTRRAAPARSPASAETGILDRRPLGRSLAEPSDDRVSPRGRPARRPGGRRAGLCPRAGRPPPRHQAVEPPARRGRERLGRPTSASPSSRAATT